jgi:tetratricopeptide (TPR) repeat protein
METTKTAKEWIEEGNRLFSGSKYEEALVCYDNAIYIDPKDDGYLRKGDTLTRLSRNEALVCYDEAIKNAPNNYRAWYGKRNILLRIAKSEQDLQKVMECTQRFLAIDIDDPQLWFLKGQIYDGMLKWTNAIECYDKLTKLEPMKAIMGWFHKGFALSNVDQHEDAITCYSTAIDLGVNIAYNYRGMSYVALQQYEKAASDFLFEQSICDILNKKLPDEEAKTQIINHMIYQDPFFNESIRDEVNKREEYKAVYIQAHRLLNILHVKMQSETTVSHYTSKGTLRKLLLPSKGEKPSPMRMHSVIHSNDTLEGQVLMKYLNTNNKYETKEDGDYRALSTSFNFNRDSLNQFRLYGKEDGREGTGVSITVKSSFFAHTTTLPTDKLMKDEDESSKKTYSLFRCIYIDPETNRVISVGQKDAYTFYRDQPNATSEEIQKAIVDYQEQINKVLEEAQKELYDLRKKAEKLTPSIVSKLLLNLRYLAKHVAFKEEQECRIIVVKSIKDKMVHPTENYKQWYMNYEVDMKPHVSEVRFGPHFDSNEAGIYREELSKIGINSESSKHPLA